MRIAEQPAPSGADSWRSSPWQSSITHISSRSRSSATPRSRSWPDWQRSARSRTARPSSRPGNAGCPSTSSSRARSRSWTNRPSEPKTIVVHGPREFTGDVSLLTDRPAAISAYARGAVPGLLRQPGRAAAGHPGDPRPQRQAARGVPDAPDHAGTLRVRRRARLRAPRRPGPDGDPRVLRQEQGAAHLDRRRRAGRPGRHGIAGGRARINCRSWPATGARVRRARRSPGWPSASA